MMLSDRLATKFYVNLNLTLGFQCCETTSNWQDQAEVGEDRHVNEYHLITDVYVYFFCCTLDLVSVQTKSGFNGCLGNVDFS